MEIASVQPFPYQYRSTLAALQREAELLKEKLEKIAIERASIEQRLEWLDATIESLKPLCEAEAQDADAPRIKAACHHVLYHLDCPATAPEIRDQLQGKGIIDISQYSNPLAVIHTTLHRMSNVRSFKVGSKTYFQLESNRQTGVLIPEKKVAAPKARHYYGQPDIEEKK